MDCKHDTKFLMGTADGIVCRCCGRVFKDFSEIAGVNAPEAEKPVEAPVEAAPAPKKARSKKK